MGMGRGKQKRNDDAVDKPQDEQGKGDSEGHRPLLGSASDETAVRRKKKVMTRHRRTVARYWCGRDRYSAPDCTRGPTSAAAAMQT